MALVLLVVTGIVRWAYFSEAEHPTLRLAHRAFPPLTKRLVIVLVDSVPFEMAYERRRLPFIASLRPRATWGTARTEEPTMTGQMVYTIVTGARPFLYNVVRNWRQNRMPHETVFDALQRAGKRIELYGDVPWFQMFGDRFDHTFTLPEEGRQPSGRPYHWHHAVNDLDLHILPHLDRALAKPTWDVLVWHIHGTDLVMHKYLRDTRLTAQKLRWADTLVKGVVQQLDDGHTTFLLLSDHGCAENGRHGYEDPEANHTFYLLMGPKVRAGLRLDIEQIDFAPTLATLFGWTPAAPSAGRPAVEALRISPADRARRVLSAAQQRARYLRAREAHLSTGVKVPKALLHRAEATVASDPRASLAASTQFLRQAWAADLDARRERRLALPAVAWATLLGFLVILGVWLGRLRGTPPRPSGRILAAVGLGLAVAWAAGWIAAVYNGRFFNDHADLWPPWAQAGFWAALIVVLAAPLLLLRRAIRRAYEAHPALSLWTVCMALAVLPGYFQGLYAPVVLVALLGLALILRADPVPRAVWGIAGSVVVLAVALVWEWSWRPHFYFTREHVVGPLGAALAVGAYGVAALAVLRGDDASRGRGAWLGVGVLAVLLALRHTLVPIDSILQFPTVGDQVLARLHLRLVAVAVTGAGWILAYRFGLRGATGAALGALAVLGAWGSSFEALAFCLFVAALAPLGRLTWLRREGLGAAALGALLLVAGRILFMQVHEFHFNFTSFHDLFRFAPNIDETLPALAGPVALRYTLPALVLVPLVLGRLAPEKRFGAILIAVTFTGARVLHLLVITRLTIDQLYANWRGLGELILTVLWVTGLVLVYGIWELAQGRAQPEPASPEPASQGG